MGSFIPGALDRVISGGITVEPDRRIFGSLRLRHFGPRPLVEDAIVKSKPTRIWNSELGIHLSHRMRPTLELFNLFNSDVSPHPPIHSPYGAPWTAVRVLIGPLCGR